MCRLRPRTGPHPYATGKEEEERSRGRLQGQRTGNRGSQLEGQEEGAHGGRRGLRLQRHRRDLHMVLRGHHSPSTYSCPAHTGHCIDASSE